MSCKVHLKFDNEVFNNNMVKTHFCGLKTLVVY